jgi:allophanate hydrolase subunit 2
MEGFKVINSGIFDTIQDLGRFGFQQYGMTVSGAMDSRLPHFFIYSNAKAH